MTIYERINSCLKNNIPAVLVVAVEKQGKGPVEVGMKMLVTENGEAFGTVGGGRLEFHAQGKCQEILKTKTPLHERYLLNEGKVFENAKTLPMVCGGVVTLYYEYIGSPVNVYIFGAGHVGQALMNTLKPLNYHVTVIDDREAIIEQFQGATRKVHMPFVEFVEKEGIKEDSYVVICTPSHTHDYDALNKIIENDYKPKYMGMLCSPKKLEEYLDGVYERFGKEINLKNFFAPIGLDLGGGSPEEIAISIASEILALHHGKKDIKSMRERRQGRYLYWKE